MILAISGPSSTGKTTLIRDLYKNQDLLKIYTGAKRVIKVEETARSLFLEHFHDKYSTFEELLNNDRDTMEFEILVAKDQVAKYEAYDKDDSTLYLCDRCPLDTMVYLSLNYQYASSQVREDYQDKYFLTLMELKDCYDKANIDVFRTLPFSDEFIEDDGFRPMQYVSRRKAELLAFDLIDVGHLAVPSNALYQLG